MYYFEHTDIMIILMIISYFELFLCFLKGQECLVFQKIGIVEAYYTPHHVVIVNEKKTKTKDFLWRISIVKWSKLVWWVCFIGTLMSTNSQNVMILRSHAKFHWELTHWKLIFLRVTLQTSKCYTNVLTYSEMIVNSKIIFL